MKTGVFVGLLLGHVSLFGSDPVPSSRLPYAGTWQGSVGVSGGIPARSTIYVALNPGATVSQINAALANCPPDQVVFLNAGTYTLSGGILLGKDRVTLRGAKNAAGVPTTVLNFTSISGGAAIRVEKGSGGWDVSNPGNFTTVNVSSGASRGSTTLALASTPTTLQIGQIMFISAPASSTVTGGGWSSWFGSRPFTQIVKVTAKSGNSVSFTPAINADYLGTGIQAHWREPGDTAYRSGIEDLSLTRGATDGHYISFAGADECWALNVKTYSVPSSTYHCYIYACNRVQLEHCDFSHMEALTSSTYCILAVHSSGLLIQNNYFHDAPNIFPMFGVNGSVFAYNYINDLPYNPGNWLSQIVFFHGSHNHYNLFEGNWCAAHYNDSGAGSRNNLFFRERMLGWDAANGGKTGNTYCFTTEPRHDNVVIAGCVMGRAGYHSSYNQMFNMDATSLGTLIRKGNYNTVNGGIPAGEALGTGETLVTSYVYPSKPSWFGNRPWPAFDPTTPGTAVVTNLPAGYRAVLGVDPPTGPVNLEPLARASASPTSGNAPLTVSFSSSGSSDPEGTALTYSWTFGDGGTATTANPSHTYQIDGTYVARLTVSDGTNSSSASDLTIRVGNQPPVLVVNASPTSGLAPLAVAFSSAGSSDPEGVTLSYAWAFGDGSTSTAANPPKTYQNPGSYAVQLTVSDGVKTSSTNLTISVIDPASTLVAAYAFEEGSGTLAADRSGNGNVGTVTGATWSSSGRFGPALSFGPGALVTINDSPSLDLTAALTLEAWVYPTGLNGSWMNLIFKPAGDPSSFLPCYVLQGSTSPSQAPSLFVSPASANLTGPSALPLNTWSHVAATYDGAVMRLYVNGNLVSSRAQTGTMGTSSERLTIGGNVFSGQNWNGLIDEVRIYNRALSASEIQTDMNNPVVPQVQKPLPPQNLRVAGAQ